MNEAVLSMAARSTSSWRCHHGALRCPVEEGQRNNPAGRLAAHWPCGQDVRIQSDLAREGIPEQMRISIHQGKAIVGNFGSAQRSDYTAIGPAKQLQGVETAAEPGQIYCTAALVAQLNGISMNWVNMNSRVSQGT